MKVIITTDLTMRDVLPASAEDGIMEVESEQPISVAAALQLTTLREGEACMTSVNGAMVLKGDRDSYLLKSGDTLQILAPLRGG